MNSGSLSAVRVLLISTYELGHQPLYPASAAGVLEHAGHEVRIADLSLEGLDEDLLAWSEAVAISVPMHTALRLALEAMPSIKALAPDLPVCIFGLYAGVGMALEELDPYLAANASGTHLAEPSRSPGETGTQAQAQAQAQPQAGATHRLAGGSWRRSATGFDAAIAGETGPELLAWLSEISDATGNLEPACETLPGSAGGYSDDLPFPSVRVSLGRAPAPGLPARHLLPPLASYAKLALGDQEILAGYVEASHGCAHRCRHCPVPVVYDGRTRLVALDQLMADIDQLVGLGARHISFGDPDFLNGPRHAMRVIDAFHSTFPELTFDATVKVEHIIRHAGDLWGGMPTWQRFSQAGCLFVTSAFESTNDVVLDHLAKGHTRADEQEAVGILRQAGIEPRPSFVPFTPWTLREDILDILDLVAEMDLVGNLDPVQLSIRLLVPPGSLLIRSGHLEGMLGPYDPDHLGYPWRSPDPVLDELQLELSQIAERAAEAGWSPDDAYQALREAVCERLSLPGSARLKPSPLPGYRSPLPPASRPRLTEAWFCCAEPTRSQRLLVGTAGCSCP